MILSSLAVYSLMSGLVLVSAPTPDDSKGAQIDSKFVASLSEDTYDEFVKQSKFALIEFYAPCISLAPNAKHFRVRSL
jgi:hypothetical protein